MEMPKITYVGEPREYHNEWCALIRLDIGDLDITADTEEACRAIIKHLTTHLD